MDNPPRRVLEPWRWAVAAVAFAALAAPAMFWDVPTWAVVPSLVALGLGIAFAVVATVLKSRAEHVSLLRLVGRVLLAPIRLLFELF